MLVLHLRGEVIKKGEEDEAANKNNSEINPMDGGFVFSDSDVYTCEVCGKTFEAKKDLQRHYSFHIVSKPFVCKKCGSTFMAKSALTMHKCTADVVQGGEEVILLVENPYVCEVCDVGFKRKRDLNNHLIENNCVTAYNCSMCGCNFRQLSGLAGHHNKVHLRVEASNETRMTQLHDISFSKNHNSPSEPDEVRCGKPELCPNRRITRSSSAKTKLRHFKASECLPNRSNKPLTEHVKSYHLSIERKIGRRKSSSGINDQITIQQFFPTKTKRLKTNICSIKEHMLNVTESISSTDEDRFYCDVCGESFEGKGELKEHYSVHTIEGRSKAENAPHICNTCGECFRRKRELTVHSRTHIPQRDALFRDESLEMMQDEQQKTSNDELFVCSTCSKSFALEKDLKSHLSSHALNKGFFCDICPKAFYLQEDLDDHVLTHYKKSSCKVCREEFELERDLRKHLLIHFSSGLICKYCHTGFENEADLVAHLESCPSKNNFVCEVCNRSFQRKCALASHAKIHQHPLVKKSFPCEFYGGTFPKNTALK